MANGEITLIINFENIEIVKKTIEDLTLENKRLRGIIKDTHYVLTNVGKTTQWYNDDVFKRLESEALK